MYQIPLKIPQKLRDTKSSNKTLKALNPIRSYSSIVLSGTQVLRFCLGIVQWHRKIQHCKQWNHDALLKNSLCGFNRVGKFRLGLSWYSSGQTTGYISPWWNPTTPSENKINDSRKWRLSTQARNGDCQYETLQCLGAKTIYIWTSLPSKMSFSWYIWNPALHFWHKKKNKHQKWSKSKSSAFSRSILDCIPLVALAPPDLFRCCHWVWQSHHLAAYPSFHLCPYPYPPWN